MNNIATSHRRSTCLRTVLSHGATWLVLLFLLISCGGGFLLAGGGIGGTGIISLGPITAFGSIFVNGVEYELDGATILADGEPIDESGLRRGMVVRVEGEVKGDSTGTARAVAYSSTLSGPVGAQTPDSFTVLGQEIGITATTRFHDFPADRVETPPLRIDDHVSISSVPNPDGSFSASAVIYRPPADQVKLNGFIVAFDPAMQTFRINTFVIDISQASLENFGPNGPADGDFVRVEGQLVDSRVVEGQLEVLPPTLLAMQVKNLQQTLAGEGERMAIEGIVEALDDWTISLLTPEGRYLVSFNETTRFEDGTPADLAQGVRIEINGTIFDNVFEADRIEVENGD